LSDGQQMWIAKDSDGRRAIIHYDMSKIRLHLISRVTTVLRAVLASSPLYITDVNGIALSDDISRLYAYSCRRYDVNGHP